MDPLVEAVKGVAGVEGGLLVVLVLMLREVHNLRTSLEARITALSTKLEEAREQLAGLRVAAGLDRSPAGVSLFQKRG